MDWLKVIFNPSFPYRLLHTTSGAFLATSVFVASIAAWGILRRNDNPVDRKILSMAMWAVIVLAPLQALLGDAHGLNTLQYQPAKIAAIEGHWKNNGDEALGLLLFAIPDMAAEKNHFELKVPHLGSLVLTHTWNKQIKGLSEFPKENRPNSTVIFFTFRIMVGLGIAMIMLGLWGAFTRLKHTMFTSKVFLRCTVVMGPAGLLAVLAGWYTTEIGRQPWVVYGLLRTADAVSPHEPTGLAVTLGIFVIAYIAVFGAGVVYITRLICSGPTITTDSTDTTSIPVSPINRLDQSDSGSAKFEIQINDESR